MKKRSVEKGHKSRSACCVLGKVCYEVDREIVVPLMKLHSWLCISLDIYTQIHSLHAHTRTTPSINQHPFRFTSYSTLTVFVLSKQLVNVVLYNYITMEAQLGSPSFARDYDTYI